MLYWMFTELRTALGALIVPLTCLSLLIPLGVAVMLGVGIQRRAEGTPASVKRDLQIARLMAFLFPNAAVLTLYINVLGGMAVQRTTKPQKPIGGVLSLLIGGTATTNQPRLLLLGFGLLLALLFVNVALAQGLRNGGWLREWVDRLRRPGAKRGEMGSAHLCTRREFNRYRRHDSEGITLLGAYWGERGSRLDTGWGRFCLTSEDAARGVLVLGSPGSGKTQAVILPVIADRMAEEHSLVIADPQGELTPHVMRFAKYTGHLVIVHDPTSADSPRYNLAEGLTTIPAAAAIAKVLIPPAVGENKFWSDSATDLLTACLIRFDNLGEIKTALDDLHALAEILAAPKDDATLAASAFSASVHSDGKVAANTIATMGTALTGWASAEVRKNTSASDFDATLIVSRKTVVVLTCPGEMREVYAPYLGATLRKIMRDLDRIGERNKDPKRPGALPVPVGIILDEFPTLGRLDSLVADVNLVRKRRISILIGAQTKGQFHLIYGDEATKALFTGLATQIVYGACDHDTAEFYSKASGTATVDANPDPNRGNLRQRPLLTSDEIVNPSSGNCTIFSRFVEANYALQVILHAELTRLYEREDWRERFTATNDNEPLVLVRGALIDMRNLAMPEPTENTDIREAEQEYVPLVPEEAEVEAIFGGVPDVDLQIAARMQAVVHQKQNGGGALAQAGVHTTPLEELKRKYGKPAKQ
jgi:hypothetical protein